MMMAPSIFQRCSFYSPKSLIHNYSLVKSFASTSSFERGRMQIVSDTNWSSQRLLPSQVSPWLMLTPEVIPKDGVSDQLFYEFYDMRANKVMSFEGDSGPHLKGSDAFKGSSHLKIAQNKWHKRLLNQP